MKNSILRLLCLMCVTMLLFGVLAACGGGEQEPTEVPTNPSVQDPTDSTGGGTTEDPTDAPANDPTDAPEDPTEVTGSEGDSSIMDGDDHVQIPFG